MRDITRANRIRQNVTIKYNNKNGYPKNSVHKKLLFNKLAAALNEIKTYLFYVFCSSRLLEYMVNISLSHTMAI